MSENSPKILKNYLVSVVTDIFWHVRNSVFSSSDGHTESGISTLSCHITTCKKKPKLGDVRAMLIGQD